ncbi:MAG: 50S ribosomal protein L35 [Dehalococcoidia bacterium]
MTKKVKVKKYKIKTHSGAKARFYISGTGKVLRRKIGINNFRRKKRGETLRDISDKLPVAPGDAARLKRLMPYA